MRKRTFFPLSLVLALFVFSACGGTLLYAEPHLRVVASNTLIESLAREVGGDHVTADHVASPKFNPHFVQPKPSDVRKTKNCDLFVHAGLDAEPWLDPLLEAVGKPELFRGGRRNADMSRGVRLLEVPDRLDRAEGDLHVFGNTHYAMNPKNARLMAETLRMKLQEIDPDHAEVFALNEKVFREKLDRKIAEWKAGCASCAGKEVVSYHRDIVYFADFLGLKSEWFVEPKPGIPPTPRHLADLEAHMKAAGVKAVVMPTYYPRATAEEIASRAGAKVAVIIQNPGEVPGTEDILGFFDYNFRTMAEVLG